MTTQLRRIAAAVALCSLLACGKPQAPKAGAENPDGAADAVYFGGPIYTGVAAAPTVEAVAVAGGRISATGARAGLEAAIGPDTEVIDLKGAAMFAMRCTLGEAPVMFNWSKLTRASSSGAGTQVWKLMAFAFM